MLKLYHGLSLCAQKVINAVGKGLEWDSHGLASNGDQLQGSYHWINVSKNIIDTTTRRVDLNT
jgi:hypothetical protein